MSPTNESEKDKASKDLILAEIPRMNGWMPPMRGVVLYDMIRAMQPNIVLEVGVFAGRSLVAQALALKDNGHGMIYGIDPWHCNRCLEGITDPPTIEYWTKNVSLHEIHNECVDAIWRFGVQDHVVLIQARSSDCQHLFPTADMIYVDGNHSEAIALRDVETYLPKLKQNGLFWFDDADWDSTKKALQLLASQCNEMSTQVDIGKWRLFSKR